MVRVVNRYKMSNTWLVGCEKKRKVYTFRRSLAPAGSKNHNEVDVSPICSEFRF